MNTSTKKRRRMLMLVVGVCLIGMIVLALALHRHYLSTREKPTVRLYDGQWDSIRVNNAIAEFIIENGYGYPVETVALTSYEMQVALEDGRVDANLETRHQNWPAWYRDNLRAGNIINIGVIFEGGAQFFVVPKWVAEEYEIKTVFDMREHWQLFRDPETPDKGVFYNGTIGWGCNEINRIKLEAYGLTMYYNIVSPGSETALDAVLKRSQDNHSPIFAYCWAPNALMGAYEWHVLKEPEYTDECWDKIMAARKDKGLRPIDQACAYETIAIQKVVHPKLIKEAPEVVEMLKQMKVGVDPLNRVLAWKREHNVIPWEISAIYFLREYEDTWKEWVTPEAHAKVKDALNRAPGADYHDSGVAAEEGPGQ